LSRSALPTSERAGRAVADDHDAELRELARVRGRRLGELGRKRR
jgi:hypothetical protein